MYKIRRFENGSSKTNKLFKVNFISSNSSLNSSTDNSMDSSIDDSMDSSMKQFYIIL